jgi:hypothetical protein
MSGSTDLAPGKDPWNSFARRLGGPPVSVNIVAKKKFPAPARNQTPVLQSVASYFTDWAILVMSIKAFNYLFHNTQYLTR